MGTMRLIEKLHWAAMRQRAESESLTLEQATARLNAKIAQLVGEPASPPTEEPPQ